MGKHIFYYVSLIALICLSIILVEQFQYQKQLQMVVVVGLGVLYVGWGVMHHNLHHSLRAKIVLEYVAVASLGVAAILFVIKSLL